MSSKKLNIKKLDLAGPSFIGSILPFGTFSIDYMQWEKE